MRSMMRGGMRVVPDDGVRRNGQDGAKGMIAGLDEMRLWNIQDGLNINPVSGPY